MRFVLKILHLFSLRWTHNHYVILLRISGTHLITKIEFQWRFELKQWHFIGHFSVVLGKLNFILLLFLINYVSRDLWFFLFFFPNNFFYVLGLLLLRFIVILHAGMWMNCPIGTEGNLVSEISYHAWHH